MKHIKLYEEFVNEASEPKFVVHKGAAVMGYASSKVQARQNAKTQGAEYSTIEDYKEQYGDKFITEAVNYLYDPQRLIDAALRKKWITKAEARLPKTKMAAEEQQREDAEDWDEDEGFGSSDFSFSLMYFMEELGYKMDVKNGKIVKVDESVNEAAEPNIPKSEWEQSNQRAENGPWMCAKYRGKYYCAVGIMHSNGDLDYVEDVEEIDKAEYDSLMK